ncbi:MAG: thiamine phosphate synthase [Lentisphaeria bacterium]|nr:thiamine phosphate synthase [Lentisphaeria bacterium]
MHKCFEERQRAFEAARGVYPVITGEFCAGRSQIEVAERVIDGGAKIIQIREKEMADAPFFELVSACRELTWKYGALLIVDDRVDIALAAQADGVHLGQEDMPFEAARKIAPELLIGISTHNEEEMLAAQSLKPGYINIGPIFPTGTKKVGYPTVGNVELSRLIPLVKVPFSVMGGIKFHHLGELHQLGVKHIAAVSAFTQAEDPAGEIRRWQTVLEG